MKIRFLKNCFAPQQYECPDDFGWYDYKWEDNFFMESEEADPNAPGREINLSNLTYKVDYEILEYP